MCFADGVGTVMTARFRLPAGRSSDVGESEVARDRPSAQVVCNVLLLDNTVQEFRANVSKHTPASERAPRLGTLQQKASKSHMPLVALCFCGASPRLVPRPPSGVEWFRGVRWWLGGGGVAPFRLLSKKVKCCLSELGSGD